MFQVATAQIRSRSDAFNAHLAHMPLNRLAIDEQAFALQLNANPPRAVKWILRIDFINPMFHSHLLWRRSYRLVIQTGAAQTEQVSLQGERQLSVLTFDQFQTLSARQGRGQIFF